MSAEIITASISAAGALFVAVAGYYFTKKREREAEWRHEKLGYYKAFISSLSLVLEGESSAEGQIAFAKCSNDLLLFAPQPVITALIAFREEIRVSNPNKSRARHDGLLAKLLFEMRRDVRIDPPDDPASFQVALWSSGVKNRSKSAP